MKIIAGKFRKQEIATPKGSKTRPTSSKLRQAVFNICQNTIIDASFLDLFAGSGAMGLEALSRGASHATFVENDRIAAQTIRQNITHFDLKEQTDVLQGDVEIMLKKLCNNNKFFTICYIDPPYFQNLSHCLEKDPLIVRIIEFFDATSGLLVPGATLFVEDSKDSPIDNLELKHMNLKSRRVYGDAVLREFIIPLL